jgi:hypothetical protein
MSMNRISNFEQLRISIKQKYPISKKSGIFAFNIHHYLFIMKYCFLFFLFLPCLSFSQNNILISGKVTDSLGVAMEMVQVTIKNNNTSTYTNTEGFYSIECARVDSAHLIFWFSGHGLKSISVAVPRNSTNLTVNCALNVISRFIQKVDITDIRQRNSPLARLDPKVLNSVPNLSGNGVETLIKTYSGVSTNSELTSQYNVRGGNFDENLVYVNDVEIYRPFLVRSGNQEGLSFINSEMVSSVLFSAGGFEAKYGDKMSSVLDVKYRKPSRFSTSASLGILGGNITTEGCFKNGKFTYLSGFRYKTTQYLLNSLETTGEYRPSFSDWQTNLTWSPGKRFEMSLLANYSQNNYRFVPEDRSTSFGTVNNAFNLNIDFEGNEIDRMITSQAALSLIYKPVDKLLLKWIFSGFISDEYENYDIDGRYSLNLLDKRVGKTTGDSIMNLGIGRFLDHARNKITAKVFQFSHLGVLSRGKHNLDWGFRVQADKFDDKLNEWTLQDSAGYSLPNTNGEFVLSDAINSRLKLQTFRYSSYFQDNYSFRAGGSMVYLNFGFRTNYWNYNREFLFSPRFTIALRPKWENDLVSRLSAGVYTQTPFYRELRDFQGNLNKNPKSQKSLHFVWGNDWIFTAWAKPFKFVAEAYYKKMTDIIPYEVDNVRIRYYANNRANAYATGLDMRVNGEFVDGVDSWFSLSFLQTKEDVAGDGHGYIPRPTDQAVTAAVFFQDYLPNNKSFKIHLLGVYGSGYPFGPRHAERYEATLRMPSYKRVDLGISKEFFDGASVSSEKRFFKSLVLNVEIFNLLGVSNTVSYLWVNVVPDTYSTAGDPPVQFAVPNRLTARRLNLRLYARF